MSLKAFNKGEVFDLWMQANQNRGDHAISQYFNSLMTLSWLKRQMWQFEIIPGIATRGSFNMVSGTIISVPMVGSGTNFSINQSLGLSSLQWTLLDKPHFCQQIRGLTMEIFLGLQHLELLITLPRVERDEWTSDNTSYSDINTGYFQTPVYTTNITPGIQFVPQQLTINNTPNTYTNATYVTTGSLSPFPLRVTVPWSVQVPQDKFFAWVTKKTAWRVEIVKAALQGNVLAQKMLQVPASQTVALTPA